MKEEKEKYCPKEVINSSRERIRLTDKRIIESYLYLEFLNKIQNEPFYPELKNQRGKENGKA